jgi:hypothetical protein
MSHHQNNSSDDKLHQTALNCRPTIKDHTTLRVTVTVTPQLLQSMQQAHFNSEYQIFRCLCSVSRHWTTKLLLCAGFLWGWRHICHCQEGTKCQLLQHNKPTIKSEHKLTEPVPVAARPNAWVCGRSLAGIVGSNPVGGTDVCLLWVLCVVRQRSVGRADHSSRGVLPTVVCLECDREASILAGRGPLWVVKKKLTEHTIWEWRWHYMEEVRDCRSTQSACL